ncbi:MAG: hypothetical protein QOD06_836 [Candidatus Binatota bacterium]|jgi:hypothetical protein|nr:hypothetical protein [Candidatus Binatota bacterium]
MRRLSGLVRALSFDAWEWSARRRHFPLWTVIVAALSVVLMSLMEDF